MLLPLDQIFAVAAAVATYALALSLWWNRRFTARTGLMVLLLICAALWSAADWMGSLRQLVPTETIRGWRLLFYATIAITPAVVVHWTRLLARRSSFIALAWYAGGVIAWAALSAGIMSNVPDVIQIGSGMVIGLVLLAMAGVLGWLGPLACALCADRQRFREGIGLMCGVLLLVLWQTCQHPWIPGFAWLPLGVLGFAGMVALSARRSGAMEVEWSPLEVALVPIFALGTIGLLRASSWEDRIWIFSGSLIIGLYAAIALHSWRKEVLRREAAESVHREVVALRTLEKDAVDFLAHQLRGPIGGIRSATDLIWSGTSGALPESLRETVGWIRVAGDRLLATTEQFLTAARVDSGQYHSRPEQVDLRECLSNLVIQVRLQLGDRPLTIRADLDGIPESAIVDRFALEQITMNFLENALKYSERGHVQLDAKREGDWLEVSILDEGRGFSPEESRRLFQKYHRSSDARITQHTGLGLGLYISKILAQSAGGSVGAQSAGLGKGSRFWVKLPMRYTAV